MKRRRVRDLLPLLLTPHQARAIRQAVGNSIADPDWWVDWGKGDQAHVRRGMKKIERQAALRGTS